MRIAFIGDVHSAAEPFSAALAAARAEGFDQLVLTGDLLTYGPDPQRCLDLAAAAIERERAVLLRGNHDSIYLGADGYGHALPDWIAESVEWTRSQVGDGALDRLRWQERWTEGPLLAAHANPFGRDDWSYLRTDEDFGRAARALVGEGFGYGVFGHVHRFARREFAGATLYTIGSAGQPRDRADPRPQWAMGELKDGTFSLSPRPIEYDWRDHRRTLETTSMSEATIAQLCRFFS